jgi:oxygen-independent coproporphyrinogen-3 oxidase
VTYRPVDSGTFFAEPDAALYVHVPFCTKKCHFCNFAITTTHNDDLRERYVRALIREIEAAPDSVPVPNSRVSAISIGGGTPALLESEQLARILDALRGTFPIATDAEVGVEFDPATVTPTKARELVDAGFTRFSVGVQSFENDVLDRANRAHDADRAREALDVLGAEHRERRAFVNLDLIYPLPGLTGDAWLEGVGHAAGLTVDAVTLYGLEIWPKTVFHHWRDNGRLGLPERDEEVRYHLRALELLRAAGFRPGAASAWLSPDSSGPYCRYLDVVWSGQPVLGFGVSSRSTVGARSWNNVSSIAGYVQAVDERRLPIESGCHRTAAQSMRQHVIRGFKRGYIDPDAFAAEFGEPLGAVFPSQIGAVLAAGLVSERDDGILELTDEGRILIFNLVHVFVEADERSSPAAAHIGVAFDEERQTT